MRADACGASQSFELVRSVNQAPADWQRPIRQSTRGKNMTFARGLMTGAVVLAAASASAFAAWESSLLPSNFDMASSRSEAVALAKEKNKAVIVYYTQTKCAPCKALQSFLRSEEAAQPFRDGYVFTAVWGSSMGATERDDYRNTYGVQGAPTWLVFNSKGDYVCTSAGGFDSVAAALPLHSAIQSRLSEVGSASASGPAPCLR